MADYGLKVHNADNEIQIDSEYTNLSLTESGSAGIAGDVYGSALPNSYKSITSSSNPPLFVWQPTSVPTGVLSYGDSASNFNKVYLMCEAETTTTINYRIYRKDTAESSDTYGLRVKNPSGSLVFDSGKDYLKVKQVNTVSLATPVNQTNYSVTGSTPWPPPAPNLSTLMPSTTVSHSGLISPWYFFSSPNIWTVELRCKTYSMYYVLIKTLEYVSTTSVKVGWNCWYYYRFSNRSTFWDVSGGTNTDSPLIIHKD